MKKSRMILSFLYPFLALASDDNLTSLSQQTEALWYAHDYTSANSLYEPLLSHSLPTWQQSRLFYNLGSLRLAQHQTTEAFAFFQKVTPSDLSLPRFGSDLFLNQGIAYLHYAQTFTITADSPFLNEQFLWIKQSLQAFDKAQTLNCEEQKIQQEATPCQLHSLIEQWARTARLQLHTLYQQRNQAWIQQASIETLASFLHLAVLKLIQHVETFKSQDLPIDSQISLLHYFQHQVDRLNPIWNALQQKEFSLSQKTAFEHAHSSYSKASNQQNVSSFLKELQQSVETLVSLIFQENPELQKVRLNYELLFMQESPSTANIQNLLSQFDQLHVEKKQLLAVEHLKHTLKSSLKALQAQHPLQARFFLVAGFSDLDSLALKKELSPASLLQQALEQAGRTLELSLLSELMAEESPQKNTPSTLLNKQQQEVITQAAAFIPAVLTEQKKRFEQAKNPTNGCQQSPWEQVIPLFDQGEQAAQQAKKLLSQPSFQVQTVINQQEQTIKNWQQALHLVLHPPSPQSAASSPQNLNETFRLIQEMYLQDQALPEQQTQELHSW